MKAIYLEKEKVFSEKELPQPVCGEHQVIVKMKAVGICGSDVHYWQKGRIGNFIVKEPMILGHECSGQITEVGSAVTKFSVGDRVVLEPGIPCMECELCKKGRYNMCQNIVFFATPPDDGVLVESIAYNENYVFKIPDEIDDYGLATMAEPLSVGLFATQRLKPAFGEKCIVFGAGLIGITCMLAARYMGCKYVAVADIRDDRLEWAKKLGADEVINTMNQTIEPNTFDIGYDATGADPCYQAAVSCIKPGGRIAFVGMAPEMSTLPVVDYVCKEISIIPSFRYGNTYPGVLDLLVEYKEGLQQLITHRVPFTFDDVERGFNIALSDPTAVKVVIDF